MLMLKGIIAQLILVVLMAISIIIFINVNLQYKTGPYLKWVSFMLLIVTIYGVLPIIGGASLHTGLFISNKVATYFYLQRIYMSVLPIFVFYYFTLRRQISSKNLTYIMLFLFFCCILMYNQNFIYRSEMINKEEITNNIGYQFVPLIMLLYIVKMKETWKFLLSAVIFIFIIMSMKRGAILVGTIAFLSYISFHWKRITTRQLLYVSILSIAIIYTLYRFIINLYANSPYFQIRLNNTLEGDSSGRGRIYQHYFEYFWGRSNPTEFLFGHGAAGTIEMFNRWAHNDWLEFAIDLGMLGVLLYLVYWCVFIWEWKTFLGERFEKRALRDCIIVYSLVAMFSMSFNGMPLAASLCIGYCLAMNSLCYVHK